MIITDVIENFWKSYYGDNCPYHKKVFPRKKAPAKKKGSDKGSGNEGMVFNINGRPNSGKKTEGTGKKGKKTAADLEKEKKEKDEERRKYEIQDEYSTRVPYYSTTRTALAPLNQSPWREDRPPVIGKIVLIFCLF